MHISNVHAKHTKNMFASRGNLYDSTVFLSLKSFVNQISQTGNFCERISHQHSPGGASVQSSQQIPLDECKNTRPIINAHNVSSDFQTTLRTKNNKPTSCADAELSRNAL